VKPELHRGKLASPVRVLAVRVLSREDLNRVRSDQKRVTVRVREFRDAHHRLARLVASGLRIPEILRITGYSAGRLTSLKSDPAFIELVASYRDKVDAAFVSGQDEFYETSVSNMLRAERQLEEHLDAADESGDLVPIKTLLAITSDRADRFGYGKKTTQTNINVDFAKRLEEMNARRGASTVIDAKANSATLAPMGQDHSPSRGDPAPTNPTAVAAGFRRRM
jgi:hypothetical protein